MQLKNVSNKIFSVFGELRAPTFLNLKKCFSREKSQGHLNYMFFDVIMIKRFHKAADSKFDDAYTRALCLFLLASLLVFSLFYLC